MEWVAKRPAGRDRAMTTGRSADLPPPPSAASLPLVRGRVWGHVKGGGAGERREHGERGLRYISTGQSTGRTVWFEHALLQGPASDGGLYLPKRSPAMARR